MSTIDDIKSRLDIVEITSQYVTLVQSGRNMKALCPFHNEKTPSFFVFPESQSWRCFGGCADGGDMFSFIMKTEELSFRDALQNLADKAGVKAKSGTKIADFTKQNRTGVKTGIKTNCS